MMENAEIDRTLQGIESLTRAMLSTPEEERVLVYQKLDPLLLGLEGAMKQGLGAVPSVDKIDELKVHLIALARLDEPDGYSDKEHCAGALGLLDELRNSGRLSTA